RRGTKGAALRVSVGYLTALSERFQDASSRPVSGLASLGHPPSHRSAPQSKASQQWLLGGPHWLTVAGAAAGWREGLNSRAAPRSRFTHNEEFVESTCVDVF